MASRQVFQLGRVRAVAANPRNSLKTEARFQRAVGASRIPGPALAANSLCLGEEKPTIRGQDGRAIDGSLSRHLGGSVRRLLTLRGVPSDILWR
jgi:hypothetical protein